MNDRERLPSARDHRPPRVGQRLRRLAITTAIGLGTAAAGVGVAAAATAGTASAPGKTIDQYLGAAGPSGPGAPWSMISLGDFTANGPGNDEGNVAVASGSATINNPFTIGGKLYLGPGVSYSSNVTPGGGVVTNSSVATDAASAATKAASEFSGLKATQTVGTLGNNSTISGTSGLNVIDASGVNITNGTVTLSGTSSSVFVINVAGDFSVSNGGVALSGGVSESNVVWNISGNLTITGGGGGGATFYGFGLDPNGQVTVHDDTWYGEVIGGTITDTSGFTVVPPPPPPPPPKSTIHGEIYLCQNGKPTTTLAPGGTVSVPALKLSSPNPLKDHKVPAGSYTMDATAPSGYHFVACTQTGVTITPTRAHQTVVVPKGAEGNGIFYVTKHVPPPPKTGYIEICKKAQGSGLDHDVFTFSVAGKTVRVPVGACSPSIKVTAGNVTVTETSRTGSTLVSVTTTPSNRLVSANLSARTAVVKVVAGNVSTETIVTFTNKVKPGTGLVKICQVAGSGISSGTDFSFTVGTTPATVPAGPAPGGYCEIVGKFHFGNLTITQAIPSGDTVTSIVTAPSGRQVSKNLSTGTVTIDVGSGVTEVTYTDTSG